jgi:hypothetical protein
LLKLKKWNNGNLLFHSSGHWKSKIKMIWILVSRLDSFGFLLLMDAGHWSGSQKVLGLTRERTKGLHRRDFQQGQVYNAKQSKSALSRWESGKIQEELLSWMSQALKHLLGSVDMGWSIPENWVMSLTFRDHYQLLPHFGQGSSWP